MLLEEPDSLLVREPNVVSQLFTKLEVSSLISGC